MIARLALAALVPLALGDYSYSYETEAPSAAPTSSMAPTRTETYAPTRKYTGAAWTQLGADIDGRARLDLAVSVALSSDGGRLAVGERGRDDNGQGSGDTRVFEYDGAAWTQLGGDIDGEAAGDESGTSVALSADGGRLVVGAPFNDGTGANSGHARVYDVCSTTTSRRLTEKVHGPVTRAFYSWTQRQFATP